MSGTCSSSMRVGARIPRFAWGPCSLALALACSAAGQPEGEQEGDEEEQQEVLPPSFDGLESERVLLSAQANDELVFAVSELRSNTQVELDGRGSLPGASAPAWLDALAGELHVPLGGALVTGVHELALRHEVGGDTLRSSTLSVEITPSTPSPLVAALDMGPVDAGTGLVAHGQGVDVVLAVLDADSDSAVVRAGSWFNPGFVVELPGLSGELQAGSRAVDFTIASPPQSRWVIATWLDATGEHAYARVMAVDGPGELIGEPGPVVTMWSVDDAAQVGALGPHELLRLESVSLLERTWVLGLEARRDAESPSPGDHLLVTRYLTAGGGPTEPLLLRGAGNSDLDLVGEGRNWTGGFAVPVLNLRADLAFAQQLRVASNGLPQLQEELRPFAGLVPAHSVWSRSADAALGGRHLFSLVLDPDLQADPETAELWVQRYDRWRDADAGGDGDGDGDGDGSGDGDGDSSVPSGAGSELIELPRVPTANPSLTSVDGVPTLLIPQGPEHEVIALRSTGAQTSVETVAGLQCEALGVASPGDDGVGDTLQLACLREGQVWIGALGDN